MQTKVFRSPNFKLYA